MVVGSVVVGGFVVVAGVVVVTGVVDVGVVHAGVTYVVVHVAGYRSRDWCYCCCGLFCC